MRLFLAIGTIAWLFVASAMTLLVVTEYIAVTNDAIVSACNSPPGTTGDALIDRSTTSGEPSWQWWPLGRSCSYNGAVYAAPSAWRGLTLVLLVFAVPLPTFGLRRAWCSLRSSPRDSADDRGAWAIEGKFE
jgi:hypothetical protein